MRPLLEIEGLRVDYGTGEGAVHAVDGVDLTIHRGETVGLAGESGSGKSTLAQALTRLLRPPAAVAGGRIVYHPADGPPVDLLSLRGQALRRFRWQEVSVVLQSAMNALNPVLSLKAQLTDVLRTHQPELTRSQRLSRATELLETVGVNPDRLQAYPHELSGGMRQRAMIAMALALRPQLVVMDEPTTALDVVTQRQILNEIAELRSSFGFAILLITHDLSLLLETADTVAVMYGGRLVEHGPAGQLHQTPSHPYTLGLLNSLPPLSGPRRELTGIPGGPPDLSSPPRGCAFAPRCARAADICGTLRPGLVPLTGQGQVACHLPLTAEASA